MELEEADVRVRAVGKFIITFSKACHNCALVCRLGAYASRLESVPININFYFLHSSTTVTDTCATVLHGRSMGPLSPSLLLLSH